MEQHAQSLALAQLVTDRPRHGRPILPRLNDNGRVLLAAYRTLAASIRDEGPITPAAEWLVDNFHIVEEQVREIRDDLPDAYYRELPKLAGGHLAGYPRVLGVAWAYVAHTDSRFDGETLRRMVVAYQQVQPLTIGELWAIAISLRLVLVENLRQTADQIIGARAARDTADRLADRLLGLAGPGDAGDALPWATDARLPRAARVQLFQRLRDQDPATTPALGWLEARLAEEGSTAEETVRLEHQRQAEVNLRVRNVITTMRVLSWFDWASFVEATGTVDAVLGTSPGYAAMDFATRDSYRHAVETLARRSGRSEVEVAQAAVDRAVADADAGPRPEPRGPVEQPPAEQRDPADQRDPVEQPPVEQRDPAERSPAADPGYHLIAAGRQAFAASIGAKGSVWDPLRVAFGASVLPYAATVLAATAVIVLLALAATTASAGLAMLILLGVLAVGPASDLAVALVNRLVVGRVKPSALPRLEFADGVPAGRRTLVAIPTLFANEANVEEQVRRLEIHYLANPDGDVRFALLSDWLDAATESAPGDDELLSAATAAIVALNARHGEAPGGGARFLLFHRRRRWNDVEGRWLGWERKRGKLHELNALLRGATATDIMVTGRPESTAPADVRYVVTVDADTRLSRGSVARLVATIAHPLNRPRLDAEQQRVVAGYGILQPRITPTLPQDHDASVFQRIFSGPAGIDPYASAVSDVYQDLYGEGSYTGKGIYDIDAFEASLAGRVPENTLLSHDLFEGSMARAGLVTDIEMFDEFPSHYLESAARQHRWARGDWQLLPWILGRGGAAPGGPTGAGLTGVARWKMLDNLRRTLSAPMAIGALAVGWMTPAVSAPLWTGLFLLALAIPAALPVASGLLPRRPAISKRSHLRGVAEDAIVAATHVVLSVILLAHQAALMADAILRTLWRLAVTRRHLLEWTTASQTKGSMDLGLGGFYRRTILGVLLAAAIGLGTLLLHPAALPVALPLVVLWLLSPAIARWISLPPAAEPGAGLTLDEASRLRLLARQTWRYFEAFVGPADHALPPDNMQEAPAVAIAHRTSPTNIGMYLLGILTARDLGWIGTVDAVERLEATLTTVEELERYRGHLYNWYDTQDLRALDPPYVSSVDSGNLCAALLVVAGACREMLDEPVTPGRALFGLGDALALARLAAAETGHERRSQTTRRLDLLDAFAPFSALPASVDGPAAWAAILLGLQQASSSLADVAAAFIAERGEAPGGELLAWVDSVQRTIASHARDQAAFGTDAPGVEAGGTFPTLRDQAALPIEDAGAAPPAAPAAHAALVRRLTAVARRAQALFDETDFTFLFDPDRKLFSIGFRVADLSLDPSYYDLLASESRLSSFLAIAKGEVPAEHWFRLGRAMTPVGRGSALISWSGSMFEYLMPSLVMDAPPGSLLASTCGLVVARQIAYGAERSVPWGISESAFSARDLEQTYQYSSFGVPGLGLKRGLAEDLVIAPYATALAAMVRPSAAVKNIARLEAAGARGRYGLHEALDYTPRRVPEGRTAVVVQSYMAHHQGMALVAIGNVLNDRPMVRRFHASPMIQATELLLQERMPRDVLVARPRADEVRAAGEVRDVVAPVLRHFTSPHDQTPRTHLLSNGRYAVMVTAAGSGYSRWGDIAVTRWREDTTCDDWGSYIYLRDTASGVVWSAGYQPTGAMPDSYEVDYSEEHAEFTRRDGSIMTTSTVVVSAEHNAEIRRVTLSNLGSHDREIELTSYAEIVLAPQAADLAHPAFGNLFVETEFVPAIGAILATRRPRSAGERHVWAAHVVAVEEQPERLAQYETDRARFVGRGRSARAPMSVIDGRPLSNTTGAVLDPIFSLRCRVALPAGATAHVIFSTVVAESRDEVLDLADKYREGAIFERAATLAWTQAQVELRHLGIDAEEAHLFQRLANRVLYSDPTLRPTPAILERNDRGAPGLWAHGISGDLPIVLVRIDEADDIDIVRQLLRAHEYWRMKLLDVDLVVINEHGISYAQDLQDALETEVRKSQSTLHREQAGTRAGVFVIRGDRLPPRDRTLLLAAARAVLLSRGGTLADQVLRLERPRSAIVAPRGPAVPARRPDPQPAPARPDLEFFNGLGGFAADGREYVTILGPGQVTPAPWINVIANDAFGFQASESGSGYTWSGNSRENQLTPWSNDPVADPPGEAIYLRDDEDGDLWGATALPIRHEGSTYIARHGMGYSRFEHERKGIGLDLVQFVATDAPVKVSVLTVENRSSRPRRLTVTAYAAWALGTSRGAAAPHIITGHDPVSGAITARNPWNADFGTRVAFLHVGGELTGWTADRTDFIGRNGSLERPAGLERGHQLRQACGPSLDPCAALQTSLQLPPGGRAEVVVLLGDAEDDGAAADLIRRFGGGEHTRELAAVRELWDDVLTTVQVRTPDRSMDLLLNGWLLYQTLACRIWARTGFYQAGGAFGFRDQLQDVSALLISRPDVARAQLLRAAARQFPQGDVQHWWHPPTGRGVRTRISDDRLFLAFVAERYVTATGDAAVLDAPVPFIEGPALAAGQADAYFGPEVSSETASLYEHCARAIDASLGIGAHGLPLMGSGDWNDGMNLVGAGGRGESTWLGWFLLAVIDKFAPVAEARGDPRAKRWRAHAAALAPAIEVHAWDGDWYRRGYFDDGTPLGSAASLECRIDAIAQSWSVLSGAGDPDRSRRAMAAVSEHLVRRGDGLVLLFTPPFDRSEADPGYIKGYLPGIRENGGQYTHGAIWSLLAFAGLGDGDAAGDLFSILNPINHASTRSGVQRYKVEPYVMAADVYAAHGHVGRGGWTWYTGSSGWMYQAGLEAILGVHVRGATLVVSPTIPRAWPGFEVRLRHGAAMYEIVVDNPNGVCEGVASARLDDIALEGPGCSIPLIDDGRTHRLHLVLGQPVR